MGIYHYPGHDPPVDLTVYKDVLKNPGPESFQNVYYIEGTTICTRIVQLQLQLHTPALNYLVFGIAPIFLLTILFYKHRIAPTFPKSHG